MPPQIGGTKHKPRVALFGAFNQEERKRAEVLFPTIHAAENYAGLKAIVDVKEIDLLIIGENEGAERYEWTESVHVICFSRFLRQLPGPFKGTYVQSSPYTLTTDQFILPSLPLPLNRVREADMLRYKGVRGFVPLSLVREHDYKEGLGTSFESYEEIIKKGAIILDPHSKNPLATIFERINPKLGVAWFPYAVNDKMAWVEAIVELWAQSDPESFPGFGDWIKSPEWMVPEEEVLRSKIKALEEEKLKTITQINQEIGVLESKLAETTQMVNQGLRRLITAQSHELKEEVEGVFRKFGFKVERVDDTIAPEMPKREDLRLRDTTREGEGWEAIVEVRGYGRSGGKMDDFVRLERFASIYEREKGRQPDKRIYVVNGQIELRPSLRKEPLAGAKDDIDSFAGDNGLLISTIDLFKAVKITKEEDFAALRQSIIQTKGRWMLGKAP